MSSYADRAKLAAGANEIRDAQKEMKEGTKAAKPDAIVIPDSTRPIQDIIRDRVKVLPGHIGLEIADDTPMEESLRILDWTTQMSDHVGFMIGDVLNFGYVKWGEKYTQALNQTGRAMSTLKNYSWVARRVAREKRMASLSFTHYKAVAGLLEETKVVDLLTKIGKEAEEGHQTSVKELRIKAWQIAPKKIKAPKRVTSGKGKKRKARPEPPPYEPNAEEQSKLDQVEEAIKGAAAAVRSAKLQQLVAKLDNKEKQRWLDLTQPIVSFYNSLEKVTGY